MKPELYVFRESVNAPGGSTTEIRRLQCTKIEESDTWITFVFIGGRCTKVPRENVRYIYGFFDDPLEIPVDAPSVVPRKPRK